MRDDTYSWFKLLQVEGFGAKSLFHIYSQLKLHDMPIADIFRCPEKELQDLFPELGKGKLSRARFENLCSVDDNRCYDEYQGIHNSGIEIITIDSDLYPQKVRERLQADAPPVIFCKGSLSLLNVPSISIVGSRNVTEQSISMTRHFSEELSKKHFNIVSGNAKGTDKAAQAAAFETDGTTTIILPQGFTNAEIQSDMDDWRSEGRILFISQFLPNTIFRGQQAMLRNKFIAALSEALVVIISGTEVEESGKMSGTFNASKTAIEMNIPTYVLSPQLFGSPPIGNKEIISLGGKEISNVDEIIL